MTRPKRSRSRVSGVSSGLTLLEQGRDAARARCRSRSRRSRRGRCPPRRPCRRRAGCGARPAARRRRPARRPCRPARTRRSAPPPARAAPPRRAAGRRPRRGRPARPRAGRPGTTCSAGISTHAPSRRTRAGSATSSASAAIARPARYSCANPISALSTTTASTTSPSSSSPSASASAAGASSAHISGVRTWSSSSRAADGPAASGRRLGPKRDRRACASVEVSPSGPASSAAATSWPGCGGSDRSRGDLGDRARGFQPLRVVLRRVADRTGAEDPERTVGQGASPSWCRRKRRACGRRCPPP